MLFIAIMSESRHAREVMMMRADVLSQQPLPCVVGF